MTRLLVKPLQSFLCLCSLICQTHSFSLRNIKRQKRKSRGFHTTGHLGIQETDFLKPFKNKAECHKLVFLIRSLKDVVRYEGFYQKSLKIFIPLPVYRYKDLCKSVFVAALFIIKKKSETLEYSTEDWLNKLYIPVSD